MIESHKINHKDVARDYLSEFLSLNKKISYAHMHN